MTANSEQYHRRGKSLLDSQGRRVWISWIMEDRFGSPATFPELKALGWAGCFSLPRLFDIGEDNSVLMEPVPELKVLRGQHMTAVRRILEPQPPEDTVETTVENIQGDSLEIITRFASQGAKHYGLLVRCAPDRSEYTRIEIDAQQNKLRIDTSHSTSDPRPNAQCLDRDPLECDFPNAGNPQVELRIFIDRSVIEVFANRNQACLTARAYPILPQSVQVALWAQGGTVSCDAIDAWEMGPIQSGIGGGDSSRLMPDCDIANAVSSNRVSR